MTSKIFKYRNENSKRVSEMGTEIFQNQLRISEKYGISINDMLTPKRIFFTSGTGRHKDELVSFELALRDAGLSLIHI